MVKYRYLWWQNTAIFNLFLVILFFTLLYLSWWKVKCNFFLIFINWVQFLYLPELFSSNAANGFPDNCSEAALSIGSWISRYILCKALYPPKNNRFIKWLTNFSNKLNVLKKLLIKYDVFYKYKVVIDIL